MKLVNLIFTCIILETGLKDGVAFQPPENAYGRTSKNPTQGSAKVFEEPLIVHQSLGELVQDAAVIVEGLVDASLPSRVRNANIAESLETDVILLVTSTLKGHLRSESGFTRLVVAQGGGHANGFTSEPATEPRLLPGDRVILFLVPDNRTSLPAVAGGLPRYQIAGIWSGKFRIERNSIVVPRASGKALQAYNQKSLADLLSDIRALVR